MHILVDDPQRQLPFWSQERLVQLSCTKFTTQATPLKAGPWICQFVRPRDLRDHRLVGLRLDIH